MTRKPAGRPHNVNRQAALVLGEKTYSGKRCKRCGTNEKYTKGSGCVECQKTNAIEARQLLRAARKGVKPNSDDLDFLETRGSHERAHVNSRRAHVQTPSPSDQLTKLTIFESSTELSGEDTEQAPNGAVGEGYGTLVQSRGDLKNTRVREYVSTVAATASAVATTADPEPLCPQCGCGTEADHEDRQGWLVRTSVWRCTICDWEGIDPPAAPKLGSDSLDTDDFLG